MKKFILISGIILLVANLLVGFILTVYPIFNIVLNSIVIIVTMALLYSLQTITMKNAFAISLSFLFSFLGLVEFILGCFSPQKFEDNLYLIVVILLLVFDGLILLITNIMSK